MGHNTFISTASIVGYIKKSLRICVLFTIIVVALFPFILGADNSDNNNTFRVLDNGLKVLLVKQDRIPMVNIAFAINVGIKDETSNSSGIVHLLEHLILLGETEFRDSDAMSLEMRRYGAHFNAHTNHDLMTFEFSVPTQYWEIGLRLLNEKLFHLKFSTEKLEKEKTIIFEEMTQNQDDPYKRGINLALQALFKNHPYEKPMAGDPEMMRKMTVEHVETFYKKYFIPAHCALAIVGDIDIKSVDEKINPIFGTHSYSEKVPSSNRFTNVLPPASNITLTEYMDINEARLIVAFLTPPASHPDKQIVEVFDQIIGNGLNPLLPRMLFKRGQPLSYSVSTMYIALSHGGAFLVSLTLDPKNLKSAQTALFNFFNKMAWKFNYSVEDYPPSQRTDITDYLETAKNTMKFDYQQFQEQGMNAALSYASYILNHQDSNPKTTNQKAKAPGSYMEQLERISASQLRDVASRYFSGKKHIVITILPNKKKHGKPKKIERRKGEHTK